MPINVTWVDNCTGVEGVEHLRTPVCGLMVHRRGEVITQIEWDFSTYDGSAEAAKSVDFWPETDKAISVLLLKQGTAHQNKVWAELLKIPQGETLTYSDIARIIGSSPRAVGNACRDNPYTLLIPCHRVVSVNGMGGYSGQRHGEYMKIKERLLAYEAVAAGIRQ